MINSLKVIMRDGMLPEANFSTSARRTKYYKLLVCPQDALEIDL